MIINDYKCILLPITNYTHWWNDCYLLSQQVFTMSCHLESIYSLYKQQQTAANNSGIQCTTTHLLSARWNHETKVSRNGEKENILVPAVRVRLARRVQQIPLSETEWKGHVHPEILRTYWWTRDGKKTAKRRTATASMNSFPQELNQAKLKYHKDFRL